MGQPQKERGHGLPSILGIVQIVTNGGTAPRSFNSYAYDEPGPVVVNEAQREELRVRKIS